MAKSFEELDSDYVDAHEKWGNHVDHCKDCARSPFACKEGLALHATWNAAWSAARRMWVTMSDEKKAEFQPDRQTPGSRKR